MTSTLRTSFRVVICLLAGFPAAIWGQALPFYAPGDSRLRHVVELEADSGEVPLSTTWPLPTLDIPADQRDKLRGYGQPGSATDAGWFVSGAAKPTRLRTFSDTPRENGEAGLQAGWTAGDFAGGAVRISYAFNPQDGMHYRLDGTYGALRYGNWWLTAGVQDRWWGPGWDGSLILSSNARPMPGIGLERGSSGVENWKAFRWLGPWHFTMFLDHMENHRADFDNTLFWGARFTFRPTRNLEIGLSRTAELCGRGHKCGLGTFADTLIAKSNRSVNPTVDEGGSRSLSLKKKSAQRWAGDLRWTPFGGPVAFYWQEYGEVFDNRNLRPRQLLQLAGLEYALPSKTMAFRTFLEFADTTCGAIGFNAGDKPTFGCAYEKDTWQAGYRFRDRSIGDSMDRDGRRFTLGFIFGETSGRSWDLRIRHFNLNKGGIAIAGLVDHTVTLVPERLWNIESSVGGTIGALRYSIGLGADHGGPISEAAHWDGRAFLALSENW